MEGIWKTYWVAEEKSAGLVLGPVCVSVLEVAHAGSRLAASCVRVCGKEDVLSLRMEGRCHPHHWMWFSIAIVWFGAGDFGQLDDLEGLEIVRGVLCDRFLTSFRSDIDPRSRSESTKASRVSQVASALGTSQTIHSE